MYVFGGYDGARSLNDIYRFDLKLSEWSPIHVIGSPPSPRGGHTAVVHGNVMYAFGGKSGRSPFNGAQRHRRHPHLTASSLHLLQPLQTCAPSLSRRARGSMSKWVRRCRHRGVRTSAWCTSALSSFSVATMGDGTSMSDLAGL